MLEHDSQLPGSRQHHVWIYNTFFSKLRKIMEYFQRRLDGALRAGSKRNRLFSKYVMDG